MEMKTVIFVFVTCTVVHHAQSGIILDKVGNTLNKIKCGVHSIGNGIFHSGQQYHPCDQKQNGSPQDGYVNQGGNGFQIWLPFTNRAQGNGGQRNPNFNSGNGNFDERNPVGGNNSGYNYGQYGSQNQYNRDRLVNNEYYGNTQKPSTDNYGYGNTHYQFPRNQVSDNMNVPSFNNPGHENNGQYVPNNQNYGGKPITILGFINNTQTLPNNQRPYGTSEPSLRNGNGNQSKLIGVGGNTTKIEHQKNTSIFTHNGGSQSQNCTLAGVTYNNNQTVPTNCTQDGRRFMTTVKGNCAAGQVADTNGICRDEY